VGVFLLTISTKIIVPFYPVPLTLQPGMVVFLSFLYTPYGMLQTLLAWFFVGALGAPVFVMGANAFIAFTGPTAGYLVGYLLAAPLIAYLKDHIRQKTFLKMMGIGMLGALIYLSLGTLRLMFLVGFKPAYFLGFHPFILGECVKIACAILTVRLIKYNFKL
jgi:biotin transporter BioY